MQASVTTKHGQVLYRRPGNPYWWVRGRDWENKLYRTSTKQSDRAAAEIRARAIAAERAVPGVRPYAVADAFAALLRYKQLARKSESTLEVLRTKAARVLEKLTEDRDCNTLGPEDIETYVARRRLDLVNEKHRVAKHVSDSTIGKELDHLFEALRLAARNRKYFGDISKLRTKVLAPAKPRKRALTEEEYVLLWRALEPRHGKVQDGTKALWIAQQPMERPAKALVEQAAALGWELTEGHVYTVRYQLRRGKKLSQATLEERRANLRKRDRRDWLLTWCAVGARYGELERIEAEHIDHDRDGDGKNPRVFLIGRKGSDEFRERWVPLTPQAYEVLCERAELFPTGPLFPHWSRSNVCAMLRRACKRLGIPPCSPNDLRRTWVTWHGKYGTSRGDVGKLAGHSPRSRMVDTVYHQLHGESGRAAADNFPKAPTQEQAREGDVVLLSSKERV